MAFCPEGDEAFFFYSETKISRLRMVVIGIFVRFFFFFFRFIWKQKPQPPACVWLLWGGGIFQTISTTRYTMNVLQRLKSDTPFLASSVLLYCCIAVLLYCFYYMLYYGNLTPLYAVLDKSDFFLYLTSVVSDSRT